ncbi:hypothetical protein BDR06DRAFT_984500 [Suillus hirtellus]|nr:hypothetical protein BDR06DRAFT_984500 [Suillus hirtellus]
MPADLVVLSHLHLLLIVSALEFLLSGQRTSALSLCSFLGSAITMAWTPYPSSSTLKIPVLFASSLNIARTPKVHTNYKFLGLAHVQDVARTYAEQIKQLKLQLNDLCKYMSALTQLYDYNCLLMAVSERDIPRLQQIINVALCNSASIRQIVNKLEDALEGAYHPQGYDATDLDIATLVYRLGGCQLLFALNQKLAIPSLRTLHTQAVFTIITPTIGTIRNEHFDNNIHAVVLSSCTESVLCGVSLMIDEIALKEMAVHFSKYNKVSGLCWKHSHLVNPVLRTYESAVNIAQKIHDGHVHLGKELTVMGASCFGRDEIFPILAAPTCKSENTNDMEQILTKAIDRWNTTGAAAQVGPVWSVATDSDATRCAAGHRLFVKSPLSESLDLYGTLINMLGLNLFTGNNEVMLDFDFKHIFKHKSLLLLTLNAYALSFDLPRVSYSIMVTSLTQ